jgi:hypothetical protein
MADFRDPEKDNHRENDTSAPMIDTSSFDSEKRENSPTSHTSHTSHSNSSHDSINSDPLSPLEHALTPDLRTDAEALSAPYITYTKTGTSIVTTGSRLPSFEVDFTADDPDDPRNWPLWYRGMIIGFVSFSTWTVVLYSTSYTSSMPGMMEEFHETSEPVATLGVTMYLFGLAVGSLILAPLSEVYGRRPVYIGSLLFFCLMVLPCALATSLSEVLVVRFFGYGRLISPFPSKLIRFSAPWLVQL